MSKAKVILKSLFLTTEILSHLVESWQPWNLETLETFDRSESKMDMHTHIHSLTYLKILSGLLFCFTLKFFTNLLPFPKVY